MPVPIPFPPPPPVGARRDFVSANPDQENDPVESPFLVAASAPGSIAPAPIFQNH